MYVARDHVSSRVRLMAESHRKRSNTIVLPILWIELKFILPIWPSLQFFIAALAIQNVMFNMNVIFLSICLLEQFVLKLPSCLVDLVSRWDGLVQTVDRFYHGLIVGVYKEHEWLARFRSKSLFFRDYYPMNSGRKLSVGHHLHHIPHIDLNNWCWVWFRTLSDRWIIDYQNIARFRFGSDPLAFGALYFQTPQIVLEEKCDGSIVWMFGASNGAWFHSI